MPAARGWLAPKGAKGVQEGGGQRRGGTLAEMTTPFRLRSDSASDPNVVIVSRSTALPASDAHSGLRKNLPQRRGS